MSEANLLEIPIDIVLLIETSKHVNIDTAKNIGKEIIKIFSESEIARLGLIAFSSESLPIIDLTLEKMKLIRLIKNIPELEGSPDLIKGLKESLEMIRDLSDKITYMKVIIIICSCSTRFQKPLKIFLPLMKAFGMHVIFIVLQSKPPTWLVSIVGKDKIIPVRWNAGPERIALRVFEVLNEMAAKKPFY